MIYPLISVIIPVYNVEKYLDRCVESVVNQTYRNLEIILVEDGSPDRCFEMCDAWQTKDYRIKVIHKENAGISSARNSGLDACTGEYISFVDGDDWIEPGMISFLFEACLQNAVNLSVCGRHVHFEEGGQIQTDKCPTENIIVDTKSFVAQMLIGNNCDCSACDKLFHKSLWDNIRFPEGKIFEDVAIMYKVVLSSSHIVTLNLPLYNYFRHSNSITKSVFNAKWFDYPINVKKLFNDIETNYPEIVDYACWTYMKAIENVLHKLYSSNRKSCLKYMSEAKELTKEISNYKYIWTKSSVFSKRDRQLCELFSRYHIAKFISKFNNVFKRMKNRLKLFMLFFITIF